MLRHHQHQFLKRYVSDEAHIMWGKAIHLASTCRAFRFPRHCTCAARAEPRVYVQLLVRLIVSLTHETGRILPQMKVIMSSVLACLPFFCFGVVLDFCNRVRFGKWSVKSEQVSSNPFIFNVSSGAVEMAARFLNRLKVIVYRCEQ